jgi:hypothetical protein
MPWHHDLTPPSSMTLAESQNYDWLHVTSQRPPLSHSRNQQQRSQDTVTSTLFSMPRIQTPYSPKSKLLCYRKSKARICTYPALHTMRGLPYCNHPL